MYRKLKGKSYGDYCQVNLIQRDPNNKQTRHITPLVIIKLSGLVIQCAVNNGQGHSQMYSRSSFSLTTSSGPSCSKGDLIFDQRHTVMCSSQLGSSA